MKAKSGFLITAIAALLLFSLVSPAHAQAVPNGAPGIPPGAIMPAPNYTPCNAQNAINTATDNNNRANQQALNNLAHNISTLYPVMSAWNACVQSLMTILQGLPNLSDPFGLTGSIITTLIAGVINGACSLAMSTVTQLENVLKSELTICLPLPSFGLNMSPSFSATTCSGGLQLSLISGFSQHPEYSTYGYSQYQRH